MTDRQAKQHLNETLVTAFMKAHPDWPVQYLPKKYETTKTNGSTQAIIAYLKAKGHQAERISTTGRMVDRSKTYSDVVGYRRTIGGMVYIPGTGTKGSSDLSAIIRGRSVKIEIREPGNPRPTKRSPKEIPARCGSSRRGLHNSSIACRFFREI